MFNIVPSSSRLPLFFTLTIITTQLLLAACTIVAPPPPRYQPTAGGSDVTVTPIPATVTPEPLVNAGGVAIAYELDPGPRRVVAYPVTTAEIFKEYADFIGGDNPLLGSDLQVELLLIRDGIDGNYTLYANQDMPATASSLVWYEYAEAASGAQAELAMSVDLFQWIFQHPVSIEQIQALPTSDADTLREKLVLLEVEGLDLINTRQILLSDNSGTQPEYTLIIFTPESSGAACNLINQYCGDCQIYCWVCGILRTHC